MNLTLLTTLCVIRPSARKHFFKECIFKEKTTKHIFMCFLLIWGNTTQLRIKTKLSQRWRTTNLRNCMVKVFVCFQELQVTLFVICWIGNFIIIFFVSFRHSSVKCPPRAGYTCALTSPPFINVLVIRILLSTDLKQCNCFIIYVLYE